jgi:antitoxin VapB
MLTKTPRTTKLFMTNRSQAVRLPKELAFPPEVTEVDIIKQGSGVLIVPKGKGWDDFFDNGPFASEDFMVTRDQPFAAEEREEF